MDSNHRPRAYQARALATWATDRYFTHGLIGSSIGVASVPISTPFLRPLLWWRMGFEPVSRTAFERLVSVDHRRQQFSLYGACAVNRKLVEMMGFEPMTPCLQGRCSPNWATPPCLMGIYLRLLLIEAWQLNNKLNPYLANTHHCQVFCLIRLRDLKNVLRS